MPWAEQQPTGKWRAKWRNKAGQQRSKAGFPRKAVALRFAGEQEAKVQRGDPSYEARSLTWGEWRDRWLELRTVEPSTERQDQQRLNAYLTPRWANVRLTRITRADVQAWVNELTRTDSKRGQPLSPASVNLIYRLFSASLKDAVHYDELAVTPCVGINLPQPAPGREVFLTHQQRDLIVEYMHDDRAHDRGRAARAAVILMTETGMRFGEMAGLHWWRVDFDQGLIHIAETWDPDGERIKAYPKSRRVRSVPMSDRARETLNQLAAASPPQKSCGLTHQVGDCRSSLVLTSSRGFPLDAHRFGQRQWNRACQLAGVQDATPHTCRHTFASWLVQAGVSLQTVSELLGQSSVVVAQRYSHLATSQHGNVLAVLNQE